MKQYTTKGIVLSRTDYGEADRIITFLTPGHGKVKAIAKGVRKAKAKLAGSIELFSVSDLTIIIGRSQISTLISARLVKNYDQIIKNLERTNLAYDFLKIINKATEDNPEEAYFHLLDQALAALNDLEISPQLTGLWFKMQLIKLSGHTPNLRTDISGKKLVESNTYEFDYDKMRFFTEEQGLFTANHIKLLRLGFGLNSPEVLKRVAKVLELINDCQNFVETVFTIYIRIA